MYLMNKYDYAKKILGEDACFDTAVPQPWLDEIAEKTGMYDSWEFVWLYDGNTFGRPFPLTIRGRVMLSVCGIGYY